MAHFRKRTHKGAIRWDVTVTRKGAPRQSKTFQTKADGERWGRDTEREIDRGAWRSTDMAERLTVGKLIERYGKEVLPKKKSASRLLSVANKLIESDLAKLPLIALTPKRVALHRDERLATRARNGGKNGKLRKNMLSTQTVRHEITLLKRAIDEATREWGLYLPAGNPVAPIRLPSMGRPRDRRLTSGEFDRLMTAARASRCANLADAIELAVETAMRREELCSLTWDDVDLNRRVAHLNMTKNGESRDVPLSGRAIEILTSRTRPLRPLPVLRIKSSALSQTFRRVCRRIGLENLRWHDLRHEGTSRLAVKLEGDVMALAAVTGHKSMQMLKRYTHLRAEDLARRLA